MAAMAAGLTTATARLSVHPWTQSPTLVSFNCSGNLAILRTSTIFKIAPGVAPPGGAAGPGAGAHPPPPPPPSARARRKRRVRAVLVLALVAFLGVLVGDGLLQFADAPAVPADGAATARAALRRLMDALLAEDAGAAAAAPPHRAFDPVDPEDPAAAAAVVAGDPHAQGQNMVSYFGMRSPSRSWSWPIIAIPRPICDRDRNLSQLPICERDRN
jgi:hypothetical protein